MFCFFKYFFGTDVHWKVGWADKINQGGREGLTYRSILYHEICKAMTPILKSLICLSFCSVFQHQNVFDQTLVILAVNSVIKISYICGGTFILAPPCTRFCVLNFLDVSHLVNISLYLFSLQTIWVVTFVFTVLMGLDIGLAIGIGYSIFTVVLRSQWPQSCMLGQFGETGLYGDMKMFPDVSYLQIPSQV